MGIKLGNKVKDTVTGFEGITIARIDYLHGCCQWCVKSQALHEGKPISGVYFDEPLLEVLEPSGVPRVKGSDPTNGGPGDPPPARSYPDRG